MSAHGGQLDLPVGRPDVRHPFETLAAPLTGRSCNGRHKSTIGETSVNYNRRVTQCS